MPKLGLISRKLGLTMLHLSEDLPSRSSDRGDLAHRAARNHRRDRRARSAGRVAARARAEGGEDGR